MPRDVNDLPDSELEVLDGVVTLGETKRALKIRWQGNTLWVPKSQIHEDSEVWEHHRDQPGGAMIVPEWLYRSWYDDGKIKVPVARAGRVREE